MADALATLHVFCGKIAAGKSTLAVKLGHADRTVLVSEDAWLDALFSDHLVSLNDYTRCSSKLRKIMGPHVVALLRSGVSVVLDFPANTVETRDWMRGILKDSQALNRLHLLSPPDEVCVQRLRQRNALGEHPFQVSDEQFFAISKHFCAPTPDEGFMIVEYT